MKRFLIILAVLLVVGGLVYGGYYLSAKKSVPPPAGGSLPAPAGGLPSGTPAATSAVPGVSLGRPSGVSGAAAGLVLVSQEKFFSFAVASDTSIIGVGPTGKIFSVSPGGILSSLNDSEIDNVLSVSFSSDAQKILFSFGSQDSKRFSVFSVPTKTWKPLSSEAVSAAWKNNSHVLTYVLDAGGIKTIYSLDTDSGKARAQKITAVHLEDFLLSWPAPDKLVLSEKPSGLLRGSIWIYDLNKKFLSAPVVENYGSSIRWDSSLTRGLVFSANQNGRGGNLRIIDASGNNVNRLGFVTLAEKCLFASENSSSSPVSASDQAVSPLPKENFLYCAVPRDQNELGRNLLPDDYLKRALYTSDSIYKVNLEDGLATTVFDDADKNFDVQNPVVFGNKYIFLNRFDQMIYALPLLAGN